jgi:SAM-dependent methyltransferase
MTAMRFDLGITINYGFLDLLEIEPIGLVRLIGWSKNLLAERNDLKFFIGSIEIPSLNVFFVRRSDLCEPDRFAGFCLEYRLPKEITDQPLRLELRGQEIWQTIVPIHMITPDYESLLSSPQVFNRDNIYGYGLPNPQVDETIVGLLANASGRLLDFGCGSGSIVRQLCAFGVDAIGIEIDRPTIRSSIGADISSRITLYNGELPLPFGDRSFDTVIAIEVIEHVPDFRSALREIARICGGTFIVTVPDMSAIPLCFPHGVIPWHLLEGTHVNFFNQTSLEVELAPYFSHLEFGRLHPVEINGSTFYTSLIARCYN